MVAQEEIKQVCRRAGSLYCTWAGATPYCPVEYQTETWLADVEVWTADTYSFVARHSPRELASFTSITVRDADRRLSGYAGDAYQAFHTRVKNLIRIEERCR